MKKFLTLAELVGILYAALIVAGSAFASNNALKFDGSNDYAIIPDSPTLDITDGITVEAWVYLDDASPRHMHFISKNEGLGSSDKAYALQTDGALKPYLFMGSICYPWTQPASLNDGVWIHLCGTFDGLYRRFYIDGVLQYEVPCDAGSQIQANNLPLLLGKLSNFGQFFHGEMDEARVWSRARSQIEIIGIMNRELSFLETLDPSLVGYWKFSEGTGQGFMDYSLWNNHGNLGNSLPPDASDPTWVESSAPVQVIKRDTILVLETVPLGVEYYRMMLSKLSLEIVVNPTSYDIHDYKVVVISGDYWGPSMIPQMRSYLQSGGNLVLGQGAPFYIAGSTNLSSIQDLLGVATYGNTVVGHIVNTEDTPFGLPYASGDTLGYLNAGTPSMANVYNPVDSLINKVYWTDGRLYAYGYTPYSGKLFYSSVAAPLDSTADLFAAAVNWMLTTTDTDDDNDVVFNPANGHYYKIIPIPPNSTWHQSRDSAIALGGYLATVTSQQEQDFVYELVLAVNSDDCWLGGTDEVTEGTWQWVTGEPFDYTSWRPGEPNNAWSDEDYIGFEVALGGQWNDSRNWFIPAGHFIVEWDSPSASAHTSMDTLYSAFRNSINENLMNVTVGDFISTNTALDVNLSTLAANGLTPVSMQVIDPDPEFGGPAVEMMVSIPDLLDGFGLLWDTTAQIVTVHGQFNDGTGFLAESEVVIIGHRSGDLNLDGQTDISDLTALVGFLFVGGDLELLASDMMDENCHFDISYLTAFVDYLFGGGPPPPGC